MITIIGRVKVRPDRAQDFERLFADYAARVRANEPGALIYQLGRSRTEACAYQVLEIYSGPEALKVHRDAPYFQPAVEAMGACMATAPEVEFFDGVE